MAIWRMRTSRFSTSSICKRTASSAACARTFRPQHGGPLDWFLKLTSSLASAKSEPVETAWLAASPDGRTLYTRLWGEHVSPSAPLWAIDTGSWQVRSLGFNVESAIMSNDGRWVYSPQWGETGVRVLDIGTGQEVANLLPEVKPYRVVIYGNDRLYVLVPGPDAHPVLPYVEKDREALRELVAIEVGSWREIGRRGGNWGLGIATSPF
jgi:hypothetical protein